MTAAEQRETALRLYRLAWRFPDHAPKPRDASCFSDYGLAGYSSYYAMTGGVSVESSVFDSSYARIVVEDCGGRWLSIKGPADYAETMLRLIPVDLRPHVENTK